MRRVELVLCLAACCNSAIRDDEFFDSGDAQGVVMLFLCLDSRDMASLIGGFARQGFRAMPEAARA